MGSAHSNRHTELSACRAEIIILDLPGIHPDKSSLFIYYLSYNIYFQYFIKKEKYYLYLPYIELYNIKAIKERQILYNNSLIFQHPDYWEDGWIALADSSGTN